MTFAEAKRAYDKAICEWLDRRPFSSANNYEVVLAKWNQDEPDPNTYGLAETLSEMPAGDSHTLADLCKVAIKNGYTADDTLILAFGWDRYGLGWYAYDEVEKAMQDAERNIARETKLEVSSKVRHGYLRIMAAGLSS